MGKQRKWSRGFLISHRRLTVLATGRLKLYNNAGAFIFVRVLFDTGSEANLITEKCANRAMLSREKFSVEMEGITGTQIVNYGMVNARIAPWFDSIREFSLHKTFIVMKKLPPAQKNECNAADIASFEHLRKADPSFHKAGNADLILGIDTWSDIILSRVIWSGKGLCAQLTRFGYAIFGTIKATPNLSATVWCGRTIMNEQNGCKLEELIQRFWAEEELSDEPVLSIEDQLAIDLYRKTTKRADDGRFIVKLPLKEGDIELGDSKKIAMDRFFQLERRLERNNELCGKYCAAMRADIESGQMRLATADERQTKGYYIPHHPVTTKFRIVLDGSCSSSNGKSVNDIQLAGPNLQEKLETIIMRFRFHRFVLSADIKKMFRQIQMNDEDLKYHKIFWRFNRNDPLREYVLTTVTFGMKSSPFIACQTMLYLADIYEEKYALAARATRNERYVDDFMSGSDTIEETTKLYHQLNAMLAEAKFSLDKWKTNCQQLLELINSDLPQNREPLQLSDEATSILGLMWQPNSDTFTFKIDEQWSRNKPVTKRSVSSAVAKIYDPSGYLAPLVITAKSFLQQLWKLSLQWDEPIDTNLNDKWRSFYEELSAINGIAIPRWIQTTKGRELELIGFSDASELGYCAVVYVKCSSGNQTWCNLLTAKTKIAPIKTLTIPRLELCAAELLSRLIKNVQLKCNLDYVPYRCFTDSNIVLAWIKSCPSTLKMYVGARIKKIQSSTSQNNWSYVNTKHNPADIGSRGMKPKELIKNELWWNGPRFLFEPPLQSDLVVPALTATDSQILESEQRRKVTVSVVRKANQLAVENVSLIDRYSSLGKIVRITTYVMLAVQKLLKCNRVQTNEKHSSAGLSKVEMGRAMDYWVRHAQSQFYRKELHDLETSDQVDKTSGLVNICPFIDMDGILRVKGRLLSADVNYDERHPIILPSESRLAKLLLEEAHRETLHGGIQLILHYVRSKYWIVGAKRAATNVVKQCLRCIRYAHHDHKQLMGNLPRERTMVTRPFAHCGVDYFGPLRVKRFDGRCKSIDTGYGAVFVCMTTRMIHIECVSDMSTDRFLWALSRLASIYQMPSVMFSDNAQTFIGARNELCNVFDAWKSGQTNDFLSSRGVQWKFITPRAPNQGGLWEAAVKSTKHHLKRMLLNNVLTFEAYQTLFAKIGSVLNSRPIVPLSDDPTELNYLTPAHAMIGERIIQPLCGNLNDLPLNRVKQQKMLDKIQQDFWNIWRKEYIGLMQNRYKWNRAERNVQVGDLVLLKEDNVPPGVWPVARILEVYHGADNLVRSAKIRTPRNDYVRPISKLVPIPPNEDESTGSTSRSH